MKKLRVTVEGRAYDVTVETLEDDDGVQAARQPSRGGGAPSPSQVAPPHGQASSPPPATAPAASGGTQVRAPMAGTVVKVVAGVGTTVKGGDTLLVVEAMKMNSNIPSPVDGVVKEVCVNAGDAVAASQVLMVLGGAQDDASKAGQ